MKALILFLLLSTSTISADLHLKNESGKDVRVKIGSKYENLNINKTLKHTLDKIFRSKVEVIYKNKTVTSVEIKLSGKDSKLRVYRKDNSWFIGPERK